METLEEGKAFLAKNWKKGVECPCCTQLVKRYVRPMHSSMARALIALFKLSKGAGEFHHVSEFVGDYRGIGDFAKLRFWGLIEEKPKDENDMRKRTSGFWRITRLGRLFVCSKEYVHSHIVLFDNGFLGFEGDRVGIKDVLGNGFNYPDLMGEYLDAETEPTEPLFPVAA